MAPENITRQGPRLAQDKIADYLRRRIIRGDFPPHTKLPSRSELSNKFGVSLSIVSAAFRELCDEELMHIIPGKGAFSLPNNHEGKRTLNIGLIGWFASLSKSEQVKHDHYWQAILSDLVSDFSSNGCSISIIGGTIVEPINIDHIASFNPDVVISHGVQLAANTVIELKRYGIPIILGNRYLEKEGVSYVAYDYANHIRQAVRIFCERGHRKIAAIFPQLLIPSEMEMARQAFFLEMIECGCGLDNSDYFRLHELPKKEQTVHNLEEFGRVETQNLLSFPEPPTAIYSYCPEIAKGTADAASEAGLKIGRDISLICSAVNDGDTPFSVILSQHKIYVQKLIDTALKISEDPNINHHILIPGRFVDRDSVADISKT